MDATATNTWERVAAWRRGVLVAVLPRQHTPESHDMSSDTSDAEVGGNGLGGHASRTAQLSGPLPLIWCPLVSIELHDA